jgi:hypothetical protein
VVLLKVLFVLEMSKADMRLFADVR